MVSTYYDQISPLEGVHVSLSHTLCDRLYDLPLGDAGARAILDAVKVMPNLQKLE